MMNFKFNTEDVTFMIDGKEIGSLQSVEASYKPAEREIKNGDNLRLFNREYTMTMDNVEINQDFEDKLFRTNGTYRVIGEGYKFPKGRKLPKKKRIRNKWKKKYKINFDLDNCVIL